MLDANKNRINFGHSLRPIDGYELDYAVGTTYSLDLEAMMFLPISLFFGEDLKVESHCSNELLTALTQVPEKVQLFCQRGKIATPYYYHSILAFWEKSIEQVHMDEYSKSFHPKIWLLRYIPKEKKAAVRYRFICTSRNLTKSNDWDLAITMEGYVGKKNVANNNPLLHFMNFLSSQAKRKIKKELLGELLKINFELSEGQENYQFYPIGTGLSHPLFKADYQTGKMLVVSPFLHTGTIEKLAKKSTSLTVLSTTYELDKLPKAITKSVAGLYQFNPLLENAFTAAADEESGTKDLSDSNVDAENEYSSSHSLHAKLFVTQQDKKVTWYLGSANCTNPAEHRNVEFLTAIQGENGKLLSPDALLRELTVGEKNGQGLFVDYQKQETVINAEQEKLEQDLRRTIYELASLDIEGRVEKNHEGLYDYLLSIAVADTYKRAEWSIGLQPLSGRNGKMHEIQNTEQPQKFLFGGYEEHRLTPYFLLTIRQDKLVLKELVLKLEIQFGDGRMGKILKSIIGDWEKLMKYLSYLLSKDTVVPMFKLDQEGGESPSASNKAGATNGHYQFPLYEKLLIASSRDISALSQTIKVVESLADETDENNQPIIQEDFKSLVATFKEILPDEN